MHSPRDEIVPIDNATAGDPAKLDAKDPIGCDMPQSHSEDGGQGGNVLLKSGEVVTDHTGIWAGATRSGKCRP